MKKLFATALCIMAFSASAETPEDWTVHGTNDDRYTVLLPTVGITREGDEWYASVNVFNGDTFTRRLRVYVNGCKKIRGQTLWTTMDGSKKGEVWDWEKNGDRIFDLVAFKVCTAAYVKDLFRLDNEKKQPTTQRYSDV